MHVVWSKKADEILNKGISLDSIGIKNWGLSREAALESLDQFLYYNIPVLGGDVCESENGVIKYNYDNWYCDRNLGESDADFIVRSIQVARDYIEKYNMQSTNQILFVIVPET
jgi:Immunity protein 40